jgi:hypothetical protein
MDGDTLLSQNSRDIVGIIEKLVHIELKQMDTESWENADSWQEFNGCSDCNGFPFRNTASDV